jgi:hypothetical protein
LALKALTSDSGGQPDVRGQPDDGVLAMDAIEQDLLACIRFWDQHGSIDGMPVAEVLGALAGHTGVRVKVEERRRVMDRSACMTALSRSPCYAALVTANGL